MCAMATILFLGGWLPPIAVPPFTWIPGVIWFTLKVFFMFFLFAMVKAFVPRYRYDQLMRLGWKVFLPLSLAMVAIVAAVLPFGGPGPTWGDMELSLAGLPGGMARSLIRALHFLPLIAYADSWG